MKTKRLLQIILVSIPIVLAYSSCKKSTTTSTANSKLGIQIQALNKSVSLPFQGSITKAGSLGTGASVTWDKATFLVSTVRFEAEMKSKLLVANPDKEDHHHPGYSKDSIEIQYTWHGPQKIDLFDLNTVIGGFSLNPGMYNEMELFVKGLESDAGTEPVFYLEGKYTTSTSVERRIVVSISQDVAFKTEKDSVEVTGTGVDFTSIIQVYLDRLMANIPVPNLDSAVLQSNGDLVISPTSNPELFSIILHNLRLDHPYHCHERGHKD